MLSLSLCTTNSSIRAWAHLDPRDPRDPRDPPGTVSLPLTCVGGHTMSLSAQEDRIPHLTKQS